IAPTCRSPCLPPWPWLPWQPTQAQANTRAPSSLLPPPGGESYGVGETPSGAAARQRCLIPSASTLTCSAVARLARRPNTYVSHEDPLKEIWQGVPSNHAAALHAFSTRYLPSGL